MSEAADIEIQPEGKGASLPVLKNKPEIETFESVGDQRDALRITAISDHEPAVEESTGEEVNQTVNSDVKETPKVEESPKPQKLASLQLREFSKANSRGERAKTARAIRDERAKYFAEKKELNAKKDELGSSIPELEGKIGSDHEDLETTLELVDSLSENWFSRTVNFLELSRANSKIDRLKAQRKLDEQELFRLKYRDTAIEARLSNPQRYNIERGKQLLEEFYDRERRKWERSPMS